MESANGSNSENHEDDGHHKRCLNLSVIGETDEDLDETSNSPETSPRSAEGVTNETVMENRHAVLQAMQKNPSLAGSGMGDVNYFDSFYLFSVQPETLLAHFTERELNDEGIGKSSRWLDPFTVNMSDCLGQFPLKPDDAIRKRIRDQIASLCFPMGMKIRMIPTVALEGAISLGWLGKEGDVADCRKLGEFGNCIILKVREELPCTRSSFGLIACLERIREKQRAAATIMRFWRKYHSKRLSRKVHHPVASRFMFAPIDPLERRRSNSPLMARTSSIHSNHSEPDRRSTSPRSGWNPEYSAKKIWSTLRQTRDSFTKESLTRETKIDDDDDDDDSGFLGWGSNSLRLSSKEMVSKSLKEMAHSSFSAMMKNQRLGETCIIEKCYVLVDVNDEASQELLSGLQRLVNLERDEKETTSLLKNIIPIPEAPLDQPEQKANSEMENMEQSCATIESIPIAELESKGRPRLSKGHPKQHRSVSEVDSVASSKFSKKSKLRMKGKTRGRRAVFGHSESATGYVKKVVPKSDSVKELIQRAIRKNVLFQSCTDAELSDLVDVFEKEDARAGKVILKQGESGTTCYVLERGTIDVYVKDKHVKVMHAGCAFGEISLLYGSPRTATLRARYDCKLWVIDQKAFHYITTQKKRERLGTIVEFLKKVKIDEKFLGDVLKPSEIQTMATASKNITFNPGEAIITKGERGDTFYLIESGDVDIFIDDERKKAIATLKEGDFFGERALLGGENTLRTATCVAVTLTNCMFIGREDFNMTLGQLQDLLLISANRERRNSLYEITCQEKSLSKSFDMRSIEKKSLLGAGAFGDIFLVSYAKEIPGVPPDTLFEMKCMSMTNIDEQQLRHRVESEKAVLNEVDNPFIIQFYGSRQDETAIYFLLETLAGGDLYELLQSNGHIPEAWARFYSASVLYGFCHMHGKHIAYRDLKPENLAMDEKGYIRIVDMGLAKKIPGGKTWTLCGTPDYMAPEIILNQGHDWAVDYWALGILLYEMIAGSAPFYSENQMKTYQMILSGNITMPSEFSKDLGDLICKLLVSSQEKRFGRTMGGPGAIMQHKWFEKIDWDALLDKEIEPPFVPRKKLGLAALSDSSSEDESDDESMMSDLTNENKMQRDGDNMAGLDTSYSSLGEGKVSYAIGKGSRHQQRMIDLIRQSKAKKTDRKEIIQSIQQTSAKGKFTNAHFRDRTVGQSSIQSVQLGIQLLNLAATAKADVKEKGEIAFDTFTLLSSKSVTIVNEFFDKEKKNLLDGHVRYLDPFIVESVECLDQFPLPDPGSNDDSLAPDALSPFCFPNGLRVRMVPRSALAGVDKLGWLGTRGDCYQLHVFTDEAGNLSHGVAITTREVLSSTDKTNGELVSILSRCRAKVVGARKIASFWRKYADRKRRHSKTLNTPNFWEKKGKHWQGLFGKKNKGEAINEDKKLKQGSASKTAIRLAKESFDEMNACARVGEVCIVEKSYVLLGTKPEEQSLLFAAMQQMVDMERERKTSFIGQNRHMLLMLMQTKLCLSKEQSEFCLPESELAQIRQPKRIFDLDLQFGTFEKISLPLPLPHVSAHWGFATLLLRVGCLELIVLLKLLLLERSVVVLGTNIEEVTSSSCAILDLLKPYKWASTFMPILPPSLIDFLSSPVPYITGMVADNGRHLQDMINDYRVQEAIASDGLSVLNLDSGKLTTSGSDQVGEMIRMFGNKIGIEFYAARLKELAASKDSTLNSFRSFFTHGPSTKERITLHSTREKIKRHLHSLAGDLYLHPETWREYLEYNEFSKAHEFTPAMFLEPLRKKMMHKLKYQEMMAHTQLFVGFVENLKNESDDRAELCRGNAAAFIVDFLNFKWPRYRNLHLS